jgi:hypothetical protein
MILIVVKMPIRADWLAGIKRRGARGLVRNGGVGTELSAGPPAVIGVHAQRHKKSRRTCCARLLTHSLYHLKAPRRTVAS